MASLNVYLLKVSNSRHVDRHLMRYPGKLRSTLGPASSVSTCLSDSTSLCRSLSRRVRSASSRDRASALLRSRSCSAFVLASCLRRLLACVPGPRPHHSPLPLNLSAFEALIFY